MKTLPTQERLQELFDYNPETGIFTYKIQRGRQPKGSVAGNTSNSTGYVEIRIDGSMFRAHRLAWVFMTGKEPDNLIDHINGVRDDNRFTNLREATYRQNLNNSIQSKQNLCVRKSERGNKWTTRLNGKHIGSFDCPLIARLAYEAEHAKQHKEFSPYYVAP